jgi:nitrogen-specific signal transduction histidine kinase
MKNNSITKKDLSITLNMLQIDRPCVDLSDDAEIKMIANRHKKSKCFKELNELMGIVIYRIRNPLAGISAAVEILNMKSKNNDANEKFFKMIFKEIDRLEHTANNLYINFSNK